MSALHQGTLITFLFILLFITRTSPHSIQDIHNLIANKTATYNANIRPVSNQTQALSISESMGIVSIQDFDEVEGKLIVAGFLVMTWRDELIAWDPASYGNMTEFATEGSYFWKPSLVLVNSHKKMLRVGNDWDLYRYYAYGIGVVTPGHIFEASCSVDVTNYPFDEQFCELQFIPWGYLSTEVYATSASSTIAKTHFIESGTWDLVETVARSYVDSEGNDSNIKFGIRLRRKPLFVIVNVLLPIVFMSFLNMLVFLIPTDSGERISYCLTVLLAIAVFLTLVGDNLPKTSNPMSILSYYLLTMLALSACIVLATAFYLRIYYCDEEKIVPEALVALVRRCGCKCRGAPEQSPTSSRIPVEPNSDDQVIDNHAMKQCNGMSSGYSSTNGHNSPSCYNNGARVFPVTSRYQRDDKGVRSPSQLSNRHMSMEMATYGDDNEKNPVSWKDVSRAVDMIFFFVFLCFLIIATVVFFAMTAD